MSTTLSLSQNVADYAYCEADSRIAPHYQTLILEDGVEEVGTAAFANNLFGEVQFPESLKRIGANAFMGCESLIHGLFFRKA